MHFLWLFSLAFIIYFRAPSPQAGGPVLVATASKVYNTSNLPKPAGVEDGDFLVAFLRNYYDSTTPPTGWTLMVSPNGGASFYHTAVFYKVASSEPADYDGVFEHYADVILVAYRNVTSGLQDVTAWDNEFSGTSHGITAPTADGLLVGLAYVDSYQPGGGPSTVTDPTGFTRHAHVANGGYGGLFVVGKPNGANGGTVTWSVSSTSWCFSLLFAIK